ncbi:MAG: hypothetical protein ACPIOQ_61355, partial [Promethearchaeia archaeon]
EQGIPRFRPPEDVQRTLLMLHPHTQRTRGISLVGMLPPLCAVAKPAAGEATTGQHAPSRAHTPAHT